MKGGASGRDKQLVDALTSDLHALVAETKKKAPPVKLMAERGLLRLRSIGPGNENVVIAISRSEDIFQTFILGCDETKNVRVVQICTSCLHRLITNEALLQNQIQTTLDTLSKLIDAQVEELRVLQCILALATASNALRSELLCRAIAMCFRIKAKKDPMTGAIAAATLRQIVVAVFERVELEDRQAESDNPGVLIPARRHTHAPANMLIGASDAYLLFQDLCLLTNGEPPHWLKGVHEMSQTFGLELIETALTGSPRLFSRHKEFSFLLKERVCSLVIRMFSPSIKQVENQQHKAGKGPLRFAGMVRLLRITRALIKEFRGLLITESEIFLTMLIRFVEDDKPLWQRTTALELIHQLCACPDLLQSFSQNYDMHSKSTKVFRDLVMAVWSLTRDLVEGGDTSGGSKTSSTGAADTGASSGNPTGDSLVPIDPPKSTTIGTYLEMLDKTDAPTISESYTVSVAFACVLDTVKSVSSLVTVPLPGQESTSAALGTVIGEETVVTGGGTSAKAGTASPEAELPLLKVMVESSFPGVISALRLLLKRAPAAPAVIEPILKAFTSMIRVCGALQLPAIRDSIVSVLCQASIPVGYSVLSDTTGGAGLLVGTLAGREGPGPGGVGSSGGSGNTGTGSGGSSSTWGVSEKNLMCIHALVNTALCLGGIMDSAWHQIVATLQLLVTLINPPNTLCKSNGGGNALGGRHGDPTLGGGGGAGPMRMQPAHTTQRPHGGHRRTASGSAISLQATAGQVAEVMEIGTLMSRLFESTPLLSDTALQHLVQAVCDVSEHTLEVVGTASVNSAVFQHNGHLFPVCKLYDIGMMNLDRIMAYWPLVTAHLIEVASHHNQDLRDVGLDAITKLVVAALAHTRVPPIQDNPGLQQAILSPLRNLSSCDSTAAQKRQLECVLQVLDSSGDSLRHAWPVVIGIIGDTLRLGGGTGGPSHPTVTANLIRIAFDSIKMVVTDFLPAIPLSVYPLLLDTIANFGTQNVDVNICLTAIGLLWNVSDYVSRHMAQMHTVPDDVVTSSLPTTSGGDGGTPPVAHTSSHGGVSGEDLWMVLFQKLSSLSVDNRSEVRKSANQTLFSTITTHGALLTDATWNLVLWTVLFPLVERVFVPADDTTPPPAEGGGGGLMVHHTRDSAEKQWDETRVLVVTGAARVFSSFHYTLRRQSDFTGAWELFLEKLSAAAASDSEEVSKAAALALQDAFRPVPASSTGPNASPGQTGDTLEQTVWEMAWQTYIRIAKSTVTRRPIANQSHLVAVVDAFAPLYQNLYKTFSASDVSKLLETLRDLADLQHHDALTISSMTRVQDSALKATVMLLQDPVEGASGGTGEKSVTRPGQRFASIVLKELAVYASLGCDPPPPPPTTKKARHGACVALALAAMGALSTQYARHCDLDAVQHGGVVEEILSILCIPMTRKYTCPSIALWRHAVHTFVSVVHATVSGVGLHAALLSNDTAVVTRAQRVWDAILRVLESALFAEAVPPAELSREERDADAALDVELVHLMRDALLKPPAGGGTTGPYGEKIYDLLRRSSVNQLSAPIPASTSLPEMLSAAAGKADGSVGDSGGGGALRAPPGARQTSGTGTPNTTSSSVGSDLARESFITLLNASLQELDASAAADTSTSINALLYSCEDVLQRYVTDEAALSPGSTMPSGRTDEALFVIQSMGPIISLERRHYAARLYPALVRCVTCQALVLRTPLMQTLQLYQALLDVSQV